MIDTRIIDGKIELPTRVAPPPPPTSFYLRGIYVVHAESDHNPRTATVSSDGLTYTLPDDWLTVGDLQAIADAIDTKFGRPIKALMMRAALRRAVLILMNDAGLEMGRFGDGRVGCVTPGGSEIPIGHDRDLPARTIRVELEAK